MVYDLLSFPHDRGQMTLILKALRIDLVDAFRARRPCSEPATGGHDLEATDRRVVAWSLGQLSRDRITSECRCRDRIGRQFFQPLLLLKRRWRVDARVVWCAELRGQFLIVLARVFPRGGGYLPG